MKPLRKSLGYIGNEGTFNIQTLLDELIDAAVLPGMLPNHITTLKHGRNCCDAHSNYPEILKNWKVFYDVLRRLAVELGLKDVVMEIEEDHNHLLLLHATCMCFNILIRLINTDSSSYFHSIVL